MTSYTFLWDNDTWDERTSLVRAGESLYIDYIAADKKRPFLDFVAGDEVFILTVKQGNFYLGGRLIVATSPVLRDQAEILLSRNDLIDKPLYVVALADQLDIFRPWTLVELETAMRLELISTTGVVNYPHSSKKKGMIDKQAFRTPYKLSQKSATVLRTYLNLPDGVTTITQIVHKDVAESSEATVAEEVGSANVNGDKHQSANEDDLSSSKVKSGDRIEGLRSKVEIELQQINIDYANKPGEDVDAIVKRRIGQGIFRSYLEEIYGVKCCMSGVTNRKLLIASHIVPWSESSPEQKTHPENGLLLSITWDALFDKGFVSFGDDGELLRSQNLDNETIQLLGISMNAKLPKDMVTEERAKNLSWHRKKHGFEESTSS